MFSLKLSLIPVVIALNVINSFCDINESVHQNNALNTSHEIPLTSIESGLKLNVSNSLPLPTIGRIHITNGFLMRSLFVVSVILMTLSAICMIRAYCSRRRWKHPKKKEEWPHPKYDTLPTAAINDSIKKNAFVLNDSDDEEFTIFDVNQRLIK